MSKNKFSLLLTIVLLILHFSYKHYVAAFIFDIYQPFIVGIAIAAISLFITDLIYSLHEQE